MSDKDKERDQVIKDEKDAEKAYRKELSDEDTAPPTVGSTEARPEDPVPLGSNEPGVPAPSTQGTTQENPDK